MLKRIIFYFLLIVNKKMVGFPTSLPRHSLNEKSISRLRNHGIVHGTKAPLTTIHSGLCPPQSTPDRIRTCDPRFRRPMLYPTELRAHGASVRTRTADLMITNQLLYQLSYGGFFILLYFIFYYLSRIIFANDYYFSSLVFSSLVCLENVRLGMLKVNGDIPRDMATL